MTDREGNEIKSGYILEHPDWGRGTAEIRFENDGHDHEHQLWMKGSTTGDVIPVDPTKVKVVVEVGTPDEASGPFKISEIRIPGPREFTCGRRTEHGTPMVYGDGGPDYWQDGREGRSCTYCGSMHPEDFLDAAEAGAPLDPANKNYKIYAFVPNPNSGKPRIWSVATHKQEGENWRQITDIDLPSLREHGWQFAKVGEYVRIGPDGATSQRKFYYQHFTQEQRTRFIELLNDGKLKMRTLADREDGQVADWVEVPLRFTHLPFFVRVDSDPISCGKPPVTEPGG